MKHGHGHYLTYTHEKCRCQDCRTAWNVWNQANKLRHHRGETVSVPVDVVRDHLTRLMEDYGCTAGDTAGAAGYARGGVVRSVLRADRTWPVPAGTARRLFAVRWEHLPDSAHVWGRFAADQIERLKGHGLTKHQIGRAIGWTAWPGSKWPQERVQVGTVRRLAAHADRLDGGCEACGRPALAGGRWCLEHFHEHVERRRKQDGRRAS